MKKGTYLRDEEHKLKMSSLKKGRKFTAEHRMKLSQSHSGSKCYAWKGGSTRKNLLIRKSLEYKIWRRAVIERDGMVCTICNTQNNLEAHHLYPFASFPELRFAINNGITLCNKCHDKIHKLK